MGDRTTVEITIGKNDYNKLVDIVSKGNDDDFNEEISCDDLSELNNNYDNSVELVILTAYEVNYADWKDLESLLHFHKIEYDKSWDAGGDYSAGKAYGRLVNGILQTVEISDHQETIIHSHNDLIERIEEGNLPTVKDILNFLKTDIKSITPFEIKPLKNKTNSIDFILEE